MEGRANYCIHITTSNAYEGAGFDGEVKLQLIGKGWKATEKQRLTSEHFKKGAHTNFQREMLDVGVPEFVRFELDGSTQNQWACDDVIVSYKGLNVRFPIYDWIETEITVASGEAFTYTGAGPELRAVRLVEVECAKGRFGWIPKPTEEDIGWGIPRYVDASKLSTLPKIFRRADERKSSFSKAMLAGLFSTNAGDINALLTVPFDFAIKDFKKFYEYVKTFRRDVKVDDPPFFHRWDTDEEFGRQQIMGVTPLALKQCTSLPDGCNITNEIQCFKEKTLEADMKEGIIFIGDYNTVFDGVQKNRNNAGKELHCPNAIGLFRPNEDDDLVPIAIQLILGDPESIFTPNDDNNDWLLAKMYYRVAAANMHEDVVDDKDLQAFALDVAIQGLGWQDGDTKGMEKEITTLDQLVKLCTILIYTSSAGHAAVNYAQFQTYQFIPNAPGGMRKAPHKKGDKVDDKRILESLPDMDMANKQIQVTYLLSEYAEDEIFLGHYPMKLFTEHRAKAVITKYKADLKTYSEVVIQRNDQYPPHEAYKWLLPDHIPNSITV